MYNVVISSCKISKIFLFIKIEKNIEIIVKQNMYTFYFKSDGKLVMVVIN